MTKLDRLVRSLPDARAIADELTARQVRLRTREGMKVAKAKGRLRGKKPKLNPRQEAHLVEPATPLRDDYRGGPGRWGLTASGSACGMRFRCSLSPVSADS